MLFINNQLVLLDKQGIDPKEPKDLYETVILDYRKKLSEYRQRFGRYVILKDRKEPKINYVDGKPGLLEPVPNATIPLRLSLTGKNGKEEWVYTETTPQFKDGIVQLETNSKIVYYGELMIDLDETPDLAYFLLEKHGMIKKGVYHVVDHASDERKKAESRRNETKLFEIIYGENAKLNLDIAYLRLMAKRWGISNADAQSKDFLQNTLHDVVRAAEERKKKNREGRGIDDFISDVRTSDGNEQIQVAGHVRDAIDRGILTFDVGDKTWKINYGDGTYAVVVTVSNQDIPQKDEVVLLYMQQDNHIYSRLISAMGSDAKEVINVETVQTTDDYAVLTKYAQSLKIKMYPRPKMDDLRGQILSKLQETAQV